ncbi:hypothetical protein BH10PAT2_BH10PAT2_0850 [soil metagenome]
MDERQHKMLQALMEKKEWVKKTERETGLTLKPALAEVDRQIQQLMRGEKVTKSDGSYGND